MLNFLKSVRGKFGPVKVYVPDLEHCRQNEINEILFYCIHNTPIHGGNITLPDFPCLTERQYLRLPDRLKSNFSEQLFDVKLKERV